MVGGDGACSGQGGMYRAAMPICAALNGETLWFQCFVGGALEHRKFTALCISVSINSNVFVSIHSGANTFP